MTAQDQLDEISAELDAMGIGEDDASVSGADAVDYLNTLRERLRAQHASPA